MVELLNTEDALAQKRWDLTQLFGSIDEWEAEFGDTQSAIVEFSEDDLDISDPESILRVLDRVSEIREKLDHVYFFALLLYQDDIRDPEREDYYSRVKSLKEECGKAVAFVMPKLGELAEEDLESLLLDPRFYPHSMFIRDIIRFKIGGNIVSVKEGQEIAALKKKCVDDATNYRKLSTTVTLGEFLDENDQPTKLIGRLIGKHLFGPDQRMRGRVYCGVYEAFGKRADSFAEVLVPHVQRKEEIARLQGYDSALEAELAVDGIPIEFYESLTSQVKANVGSLRRYLDMRRKLMGLDSIHMWDLVASLDAGVKVESTIQEDINLCVEAAEKAVGPGYASELRDLLEGPYVDWLPREGKDPNLDRVSNSYRKPPYIHVNHQTGNISKLFRLMHEAGHAMHDIICEANQPYDLSMMTMDSAEVAAFTHEEMLLAYLKESSDPRLVRLAKFYETQRIATSVYRQIMIADFQFKLHEAIRRGDEMDGEAISQLYEDTLAFFYGDEMARDGVSRYGWQRIHHLTQGFYVWRYTAGIAASYHALKNGPEKHLEFLRSGKSDYPLELRRKSGSDPLAPDYLNPVFERLDTLIRELSPVE